ncbi:MAG: hypothetical protein GY772_09670, partial [bacterium]|nr:hypothetical protein [bacterium]
MFAIRALNIHRYKLALEDQGSRDAQSLAAIENEAVVFPGSFVSQCHHDLRGEVLPTITAHRALSRDADVAAAELRKPSALRTAYISFLNAHFNGKKAVDLIFRYGKQDRALVQAMDEDTEAVRQSWHGRQEAWLAGEGPRPRQDARDVEPNQQAREAARLRIIWRYQENQRLKQRRAEAAANQPCYVCGWRQEGGAAQSRAAMTWCLRCNQTVCYWHVAQRGLMLCQRCGEQHGTGNIMAIAQLPRHEWPGACEAKHCQTFREVIGFCYVCNRWLCTACSLDQMPPRCVHCPVLEQASGGDLGKPPTEHRVARRLTTREAVEAATAKAGKGRLPKHGFAEGSRRGHGQVHRAGERAQTWR